MHPDETVLAVGMVEAARRLGLSARTVCNPRTTSGTAEPKSGSSRRIIPVAALEAFVQGNHPYRPQG